MQTVTTLIELRAAVDELRLKGEIALVPTMGALHEGHLSLVRKARESAANIVASIFVNPKQFGAGEDLDSYPRQLALDSQKLEAEGVKLLWAPPVSEVYPAGFSSNISVSGVSEGFCGGDRPGHFDGVATVVCKLFNQVRPDYAVFGEKDWQQLAVIRQMARDLNLSFPHADAIIGAPIVREPDGLAMSSRNAYLSTQERAAAVALPHAIKTAISAIEGGATVAVTLEHLQAELIKAGFSSVDYAALADAQSLALLDQAPERPARLLVAAKIGSTRLIDNIGVGPRYD